MRSQGFTSPRALSINPVNSELAGSAKISDGMPFCHSQISRRYRQRPGPVILSAYFEHLFA